MSKNVCVCTEEVNVFALFVFRYNFYILFFIPHEQGGCLLDVCGGG